MSHRLSFAMPSVLSKPATSVTSASTNRGAETGERRHKQHQLLMAQFRALIPDCYQGNRAVLAIHCCISQQKMPPTVAEVAVWLWTAQLIPRIVRLEQVVAKIAIVIVIFLR